MKKIAIAAIGVLAAGAASAAPDWSKAPVRKMTLFYPGQSGLEWIMNKADHSAVPDIVDKKRPCAKCHEGDAAEVGDKIVAGKPVGNSKTVLEPKPPAGKVGSIPVAFQAAHDGNKIYFRFEWVPPKIGTSKMDQKNEVKLTMMFDGGGTVPGAELNGCWGTCHNDLRTMKDGKDDKKTKYVTGGDVKAGKFYDLVQWTSKGAKHDGYVADKRVMEGGKGLVEAKGEKKGDEWVVTFTRKLAGGGEGDIALASGKVYNFGFAIHDDHAEGRFHHVSLGYTLGIDAKADISANK